MLKYHGSHLARSGTIGLILILLVIAVGLQPKHLWQWSTATRYHAEFAEAGGLAVGNAVMVSGMTVGSVTDLSLRAGTVVVSFIVDGNHRVGADSTAHIRTRTLLGERVLAVESAGDARLHANGLIPLARTSSPYALTQAVDELTSNTAGTDTADLNQALDTLAATIDQIAPRLGPAFDGFTRLSQSLNSRDEVLRDLLRNTRDVTGVLAARSQHLNTLIIDANLLVDVLNNRRNEVVGLLTGISVVSRELSGLVADNEAALAPALAKLNAVTAMLQKNRDNIAQALPGLARYQVTQGETVSSGFYYNAFIPNLVPAQAIQPFLDYAFGFRRGVNAGQPPDNAGPRAEFPLPRNGIPGGS
ncbi:MCE family protein [Mycolicibacterium diernhoferi]|uniref:Mammalian cell entry protein n=1 Tax=Mycolicibacterium diernhoferi TaxID=1801 RepID=A0A1Q4HFT7_9MYCO|nr:MCE family protein [Mycolicibacterium diernhoferi]OJZ66419.1 mammalian cell entry protein [Mycolicibacterium diernhoferi]OPE56379.1 mammalian cell entry protein [Mycolicibacterium diernhoferi]PEG54219.1 mammalian cell entry protein [Mycolicibacterium diernhoferi]QYL24592.1 MCE family protein [Mycolicibacterium diernhoferi]